VRRIGWGPPFVAALLAFLYFPLMLVALLSFNDLPIASLPFRDFTLKWYEDMFADGAIRRAFVTSLKTALAVAALSTLVGVPGAFAVARRRFATKPVYLAAVLLPISLPGVVLGFSILSAMRYLQWSPSLAAVVLGQVTYAFPFVLLIMLAALQDFDRRLEEAGRDLGCTHRDVLRRVTLPILMPVMAGAAIIVFAISMDEFVITNFLVGSEPTLPPVIWSIMNRRGIPPTINAIATILMIASLIFVVSVTAFLERNARLRYRVHSLS
jgi:ABC-type spermidine/putrescine transport system permease subunit II